MLIKTILYFKRFFLSSHERKAKMEEQAILEFTFAINQVIENHRKKLTSLLINEHEYKIKRKDDFYFLEDFGWTTAYGLYLELSKE
tara:strand:- start:156 stop:413 length:258 start_codon:yes stop_codon:yes gene_type:complete